MFGAGKAGPEKTSTIRTRVFGAAYICYGQGTDLECDGQVEVLQGSQSIPVEGQPDVMVQRGCLGEYRVLPVSGHGVWFLEGNSVPW